MATETEIANLALGHIAIGKTIANLDEKSEEARTIKRIYDIAKNAVLRAFDWPFSTKILALSLVEEEPNTEWAYSYRYPSDCLKIRRILSGLRNDTHQSRSRYKISQDTAGKLIFSDEEDAEAEYTAGGLSQQFWPEDFKLAFSFYIAFLVAPTLTMGDPNKLGDRAFKLYEAMGTRAAANSANEEQPDEIPEAESIRARD